MKKSNVINTFKKNLARTRKERGLSQLELGKMIGATQRVIAYYENEAANIPLARLQDLANALKVTVVELLGDINGKKSEVQQLDVRVIRKIKQIEALPRRAQEAVWHTINTTIEMHAMKNKKKK